LNHYKRSLALGGSRTLPELFAAAGCKFEFSQATIAPLVKLVWDELARLPAER
jgi:oligoendopeptidase F